MTFLTSKIIGEHCRKGEAVSMAKAQALLSKSRKLTLGPLLNNCVKYQIIPAREQSRFETFKRNRHWLVQFTC